MEKSQSFISATQFLTVAQDGASTCNVTVRIACISFGTQPCRKKNLVTARVFMLLKSLASADMFPFRLFNKKNLQYFT